MKSYTGHKADVYNVYSYNIRIHGFTCGKIVFFPPLTSSKIAAYDLCQSTAFPPIQRLRRSVRQVR